MSKQRRIKKLVKGHLNSKDVTGADVHADKEERLLQLMGKSTANPGNNLTDAQLLAVLLDADADSASHKDDFAPFDARETADTDGDGIGNNKDIHDADVALAAKQVVLDQLFLDIQTQTAAAGPIDTIVSDAETKNTAGTLTLEEYNAAYAALDIPGQLIADFEAGEAEVTTIWNSVKDLVPTPNVEYDGKLVTNSHTDANAAFTHITVTLDLQAEKDKVTGPAGSFAGRLSAIPEPAA